MRYVSSWLIISVLAASFIAGCGSKPEAASGKTSAGKTVKLCAMCGQIKGSDVCCKEGQELCSKCDLAKGSPGCCVLPKNTTDDVELCTHCGFIKGSEQCCTGEEQTACSKCGLIKGSPGCCRIKQPS